MLPWMRRILPIFLGLRMNDRFDLWQSTSKVQSDGHQYTSSWWFYQVLRSSKVPVEHSCLHRVFAEFIVGFSISSLTSGFPMFRTLILASTVAKDKHRPDNKYLVIAHQEAAQNWKFLRLFWCIHRVFPLQSNLPFGVSSWLNWLPIFRR